nr:hypothetical protein [Tanacetum cinerariifolium]
MSPITSTIPPTTSTTHYTSQFIYTKSSDDNTPDTPPSPTYEIPPVEVAPPTSRILPAPSGVRCRQATLVLHEQPISYGRSYRYHPSGTVHMMTVRKRVGDSPSGSSSETSLDSSTDAPSDSSLGHTSSDYSSSALPSSTRSSHQLCSSVSSIPYSFAAITKRPSLSSSARPFCKRSRSPTISIQVSSPIHKALSYVRADMLPPHKRIKSSNSVTDLEVSSNESSESYVPREIGLGVDIDVEGSDEPYSEPDIDPDV